MENVIEVLTYDKELDSKYKEHLLNDNKYYKGCRSAY